MLFYPVLHQHVLLGKIKSFILAEYFDNLLS